MELKKVIQVPLGNKTQDFALFLIEGKLHCFLLLARGLRSLPRQAPFETVDEAERFLHNRVSAHGRIAS